MDVEMETAAYDYSLLPPHVITEILKNVPVHELGNMASVCSAWHDASLSRAITHNISVRLYDNTAIERFLNATDVRQFAHVEFSKIYFHNFKYREFLNKFSNTIRHIQILDCDLEFCQLLECIAILGKLESLTIHTNNNNSKWKAAVDTPEITDALVKNLNRLKTLSIACQYHQSYDAINFILSKCIKLESLTYVVNIEHTTDAQVDEIYKNMIVAMAQWNRVDLKYLSIENHDSVKCNAFFTSFRTLNVIRIKKLYLRNIRTSYDAQCFDQFCAGMYDIEELDMDIKAHSNLSSICKYLTNLKRLAINAMPTKHIGIIESLHELEELEVTAFDVPEKDLLKIFTSKMPNLRKLSLNLMILNKTCLIALCNNFKNLEYLNVTLDTTYYYPIFKNLRKLKNLTIYCEDNPDDIYDEEDSNILELQNLERLYIDMFTSAMTKEQIAKLPNLKMHKCMAESYDEPAK